MKYGKYVVLLISIMVLSGLVILYINNKQTILIIRIHTTSLSTEKKQNTLLSQGLGILKKEYSKLPFIQTLHFVANTNNELLYKKMGRALRRKNIVAMFIYTEELSPIDIALRKDISRNISLYIKNNIPVTFSLKYSKPAQDTLEFPYEFNVFVQKNAEQIAQYQFLQIIKAKNVFIIQDGTDYAVQLYTRFADIISKNTSMHMSQLRIDPFSSRNYDAVAKSIVASKTDSILFFGIPYVASHFLSHLQSASFDGCFIGSQMLFERSFVYEAGSYLKNIYISTSTYTNTLSYRNMLNRYVSLYPDLSTPSLRFIEIYSTLQIIMQTISNELTVDDMVRYNFNTILGNVIFNDYKTIEGVYSIYNIENAHFVEIQ